MLLSFTHGCFSFLPVELHHTLSRITAPFFLIFFWMFPSFCVLSPSQKNGSVKSTAELSSKTLETPSKTSSVSTKSSSGLSYGIHITLFVTKKKLFEPSRLYYKCNKNSESRAAASASAVPKTVIFICVPGRKLRIAAIKIHRKFWASGVMDPSGISLIFFLRDFPSVTTAQLIPCLAAGMQLFSHLSAKNVTVLSWMIPILTNCWREFQPQWLNTWCMYCRPTLAFCLLVLLMSVLWIFTCI